VCKTIRLEAGVPPEGVWSSSPHYLPVRSSNEAVHVLLGAIAQGEDALRIRALVRPRINELRKAVSAEFLQEVLYVHAASGDGSEDTHPL
jgi:hypothetical protein